MKILRDSQGIALVVVIIVMVILLSITGASLLFSGLFLGPVGDQLKFGVKDNKAIYYSSQAINLVQNNWG